MGEMMRIRWVDEEHPDLEEALNNQLPTEVEVSPCGLMLVSLFIHFSLLDESGSKHIVKQVEEYSVMTYGLCGMDFFPSNVESIEGLTRVSQLDDVGLCHKCSVEAEYIFYASEPSGD